jgi:CheY-like chemotaxis protein
MNDIVSMKPRILLVDDREDNLLSIEAILKQDGYEFTMAYSGGEALKILNRESDFAMILMDVKMPILSGFETATLIYERETLKHIPIIFITANYYGEENLFKGYQAGGIDYIFKPINPEVLRAKVSIFIDLYRKNRLLVEQDQRLLQTNSDLSTEVKVLRIGELKLKLINRNLRKKIADLEYLMSVCNIPVEQSEFVNSDLTVLVNGLLNDMQDEVRSATITVGRLPSLLISPRLMRPLFKNLISNALLSQQPSIAPVIRIHSAMRPVIDGMENQGEEKYCEIFVEEHYNGFHENFPGEINGEFIDTELGLAFCQKIMEHHKGHISAKSKVNEGLTYIISLPVQNESVHKFRVNHADVL